MSQQQRDAAKEGAALQQRTLKFINQLMELEKKDAAKMGVGKWPEYTRLVLGPDGNHEATSEELKADLLAIPPPPIEPDGSWESLIEGMRWSVQTLEVKISQLERTGAATERGAMRLGKITNGLRAIYDEMSALLARMEKMPDLDQTIQ